MNDRELLELAAKAAGSDVFMLGDTWVQHIGEKVEGIDRWVGSWNPLTDDGDALRLAVKLHMEIDHNHPADQQPWASARAAPSHMYSVDEFDDESERMAATRRAITRAAAEIGKAMP